MTVTQPQYENILYIKSSESIGHQLVIQHLTHEQRSQMSMKQYIDQLAYQFQRDVRTQQKIASETLKVHQMIPIFLSKSLILCPLQSQRKAIQYYINVTHVIAASSHQQNTRIHFNNNLSLIVPMPLNQFVRKWKDAYLLTALM
ncbi:competence protein ComK [Staphylococcus pseudintermedius]|uniref:competence protein ComK n=1 Tax=Staphylococcus pseudintermedius TaxID=283734 RepID=UPI000CFD36F5|nr:competence protein ComK [Staphylococcus pseudintermedius]EHS7160061.1 competence protein ComK [Staphylococcus pseudintermedius]EIE3643679.1 competence protein ComK [Staphylococcus pseudintermedius]EJF1329997.1 competence protein ComK [Staphylococcus pseudintermedius]MCE5528370.1 competence protein ComK [Staphylococcus pseudintermedius]MCE5579215.1 competence protein ComK [Staphylococcus pseudintermedius]